MYGWHSGLASLSSIEATLNVRKKERERRIEDGKKGRCKRIGERKKAKKNRRKK